MNSISGGRILYACAMQGIRLHPLPTRTNGFPCHVPASIRHCYKVTTRETVNSEIQHGTRQGKFYSLLVVRDDRHGTYLVVDGRL